MIVLLVHATMVSFKHTMQNSVVRLPPVIPGAASPLHLLSQNPKAVSHDLLVQML